MLRNPRFPAVAVAALLAVAPPPARAAALYWTAPGDNGTTGTAARYDIRRSTQMLTESSFTLGDTVGGVPAPAPAGTAQSCAVAIPLKGVTYYFALKSQDAAGNWSAISDVAAFTSSVAVGNLRLPSEVQFAPPRPSPASDRTLLHVETPLQLAAEIAVFDAMGRRVRLLWRGALEPGRRDIEWNLRDDGGRSVPRGVYFVRARVGTGVYLRRVVVTP